MDPVEGVLGEVSIKADGLKGARTVAGRKGGAGGSQFSTGNHSYRLTRNYEMGNVKTDAQLVDEGYENPTVYGKDEVREPLSAGKETVRHPSSHQCEGRVGILSEGRLLTLEAGKAI